MGILLSIIKWLIIILAILFVLNFTVYFFNLDMKLTAALQPLFEKWYDRLERDKRL